MSRKFPLACRIVLRRAACNVKGFDVPVIGNMFTNRANCEVAPRNHRAGASSRGTNRAIQAKSRHICGNLACRRIPRGPALPIANAFGHICGNLAFRWHRTWPALALSDRDRRRRQRHRDRDPRGLQPAPPAPCQHDDLARVSSACHSPARLTTGLPTGNGHRLLHCWTWEVRSITDAP
jgi:hypothetical protein